MASNKIGIEVQVEFPTVAELQRQLADKWRNVKNGFEGKINIGVDGHSLNRVKKQIQTALDGREFQIQLDSKLALGEIGKIQKELKELDAKIGKVREIKVKFDVGDMDKSMKEIIENNQKIQNGMDKTNSKTKEQTSNLERQIGAYDKITRKIKEINGKKVVTQIRTTHTGDSGETTVRTINSAGVTDDVTEDKKRALKEIQDIMKRIHKIEMDSMSAEGDHLKLLQDEKKLQNQQLDILKTMYYQKHKVNAISSTDLKEVKRMQDVAKAIKEAQQFQQALNGQQKEQASNVQKLVSLEQKIHSLKMKQVTANEGEQASLREQISHYETIQGKIRDNLTGENKITSEQEEQIANLKTINSLELSRANEKKTQQAIDAKTAQDQREASQKIMADLKEIHTLKMRIAQIETRRDQGGLFGSQEEAQLRVLQQQLRVSADLAQETRERFKTAGLVTQETQEQLGKMQQVNSAELNRVNNAMKVVAQNDRITAEAQKQESAYREILQVEQRISRLQRDMIFAGMRERSIIEDAVQKERAKADAMTDQLRIAGRLTTERQKEINKIREASRIEADNADKRQLAREKDQQFNDAGGLIDPYTTYANGRQAFDTILQSMKEIDESFYQVAKVADASDLAMQNFKDTAFDVGSTLGTTASEYMLAVEKWVTAGKTFEESQHLGQVSQVGAFVGNITPDEMVKYMSVPLNAFEDTGVKAEDIINSMNEVANNNAIEMNDLGKAYVRSATTAKNAGATYAELNGMIAGAQEATRKGGERIGTGIKTIGLNITAIQSRFSADNKKKYDFLTDVVGIDMEDSEGNAVSMTNVIEQLTDKWDTLSKTEKGNATIMLAGKEHAETLQAIIDEWDTVQKVAEETNEQMNMGKDGSAYVEFAKQSDSLRFKLAELKNMWDKFMNTIGNSDGVMSSVLDALIDGLKMLSNLAQNPAVMGLLKAIAGILVVHAGANGMKRLWDLLDTGLKGQVKAVTDIGNAWKNVRRDVSNATVAVGQFDLAERRAGNNGAPNVGINGGLGMDANGRRTTVDRNGNRIDIDSHSPMVDRNGRYVRDRNGNQVYDPRDHDPRRYTDNRGNELRDRQGNPIVNPERDRANTPAPTNNNAGRATEGAVKGVGKALGKTLSLVPLLGDALIIMEIMGVPVFEKMGEGFDAMFKSTKDQLNETEKLIEKFKGANELVNGTVDANRSRVEDLQDDLAELGIAKADKKGNAVLDESGNLQAGKKGYVEDEEAFKNFKSDFNAQAEGMGLVDENGVAIRITMNDTAHILEAMKAMNAEKDKLAKEAQVKVVKQISKDTNKLSEQEGDVSKAKLEYEQAMARASKAKEMLEALKDANGNVVDPQAYAMWKGELDSANKKIKTTKKDLDNTSEAYKKTQKAIGDNARALMSEGEAFDASKLSKEQATDTTKAMLVEYKKMKSDSNQLADIQKKLADGTALSDEEFQSLIKRFPEYENKGKGKIETDKKLQKELNKVIDKEEEKMGKTLEGAEVAMTTAGEQAGMQEVVKGAIDSTTGSTKEAKEATKDLNKEVDKIPADKSVAVRVSATFSKGWESLKEWWGKLTNKTVTVNAEGKGGGGGSKKDSIQVGTTRTTRSGRSSASVSTGTPVRGAGAIVSRATATAGTKERNNTRVSEDAWRYWDTELKGNKLESALRDLERAVTVAKDDYKKIIDSLTKQLSVIKSQISNEKLLLSQKDKQMNSVLNNLKKYGFRVNTGSNTISNLSHSKSLTGDKAEKAEELLQSFYSLTTEMDGINDRIKDLNTSLKTKAEEIKQNKISLEMKNFEVILKKVTALQTKVANSDSLMGTKINQVGALSKELSLRANEEALAQSKTNLKDLLKQFNEFSIKAVGFEENGEQLKSTMDSLGQSILAQADNIIRYRQAINDLEFARINEDMQRFNNTLDKQGNNLTNNMNNLKEGLLSGTDLDDLASYKSSQIDLSRSNVYESEAKQRIALEKEVQEALTAYAKKNVDRAKGVANSQLQISSTMYNTLLKMQKDYTNGNAVVTKQITSQYGSDMDNIAMIDKDYATVAKNLEKYYEDIRKKEDALKKKYMEDMAKAKTPLQEQALDDKFIVDSLGIQKEYYNAQIKANNEAIKELNKQLADASEADKSKIREQIESYEQQNVDTQNKIKDTIKSRFDFELSLMSEVISKSNEAKIALQNTYDILSSLGVGNYSGKGTILDAMLDVERNRNAQIKKNVADLQRQQEMYEVGSYEWKIINSELAQYNQQLSESNKQLLDMNKNILANSFSATTSDLERTLFGGKSHDAWQQYQQLWMEGLEKEIALEKLYKRMADLGTTVNKEKLDILAEQEKLSKFEAEHLNKQLDIIELQQKVDNLNKQKTVQVLTQNEFGQWDWSYEADATQLDKANDELAQAQLALQQMEEKAREDYLQQMNKILSDAQNGHYESVEDFREAMEDLGEAFDTAVGDIPEIGDDYIDDLVEAYAKFITDNAGVVAGNPVDTYLVQATETMTDTLKKTFTDISKDLGEIFANALLAKMPSGTAVNANRAISSGSTAISIERLEFPNATNKDEIQEAILGLPQLALQKSKSKV